MAQRHSPTVREIMTSPAVSVKEEQSLGEILGAFRELQSDSIPVTDEEGRLTGIVSLNRILDIFSPEGVRAKSLLRSCIDFEPHRPEQEERVLDAERLNRIHVRDLVSREVNSVDLDTTVEQARDLMILHRTTILPVIGPRGGLAGVVTLFHVVAGLLRERGLKP